MINTYAYEIKPHIFDSIIVTIKDDDDNYIELLAMKDKTIWDYRTFLHGEVNGTVFQKDYSNSKYYKKVGRGRIKDEKRTLDIISRLVGTGKHIILFRLDDYVKDNNFEGNIKISFK